LRSLHLDEMPFLLHISTDSIEVPYPKTLRDATECGGILREEERLRREALRPSVEMKCACVYVRDVIPAQGTSII